MILSPERTLMFRGAYTALVTPFRDGQVDIEALSRLIERQIQGGIDGLVPCGTTGESPTLSVEEQLRVIEVTLDVARGRVPVIAGAGSNDTSCAIELVRACKSLGVAATLQITPYYNRPSQAGMVKHFTAIAEVGLPLIIYNVPSRTSVDLADETMGHLAEHPMIVGIKDATGNMARAARLRELCGPNFALLSGDDFTILPFLATGGVGVISVVSNLLPGLVAQLCRAIAEDRLSEAQELHRRHLPLTRLLFAQPSPGPVKAAMARLGWVSPDTRLPILPLSEEAPEYRELERQLHNVELLS